MVGPAWPRNEHTGLLPVVRFSDGELLSDPRCAPCPQWQDFRGVSYSRVGGSSEESDYHPLVEALVRVVGGRAGP